MILHNDRKSFEEKLERIEMYEAIIEGLYCLLGNIDI